MSPTPPHTSYRPDDLSSPDPLASSFNDENDRSNFTNGSRQSPARKHNVTTARNLRRNSSAAPSLEHIAIPSSPFRTVSEQNLSPWKIRVTVEAEPDDMNSDVPMTRTMTRTMKIPLRQDSSPVDSAKTSRGRNSQPASSKSKRSSTPTRNQKSNSRSRRQSVTDLDVRPLGDDAESDDWTKQKKSPSPRKRRSARTRKSSTGTDAAAGPTLSPEKSSRRRSSTAAFEVRQDTDAEVPGAQEEEQAIEQPEKGSPELRQIDLNRVSVRPRAMSTRSAADDNQDISDESLPQKPVRSSARKPVELRKVSVNSAISYPTPSPTSSYHGDSDGIGVVDNGEDIHEAGQVGFDTVLESEGFTMIDLDTIPSARRYLTPVEEDPKPSDLIIEHAIPISQTSSTTAESMLETRSESVVRTEPTAERQLQPQPTIDYPTLNVDDTEFSSTVPSSPPIAEKEKSLLRIPTSNLRKVTPITFSSPKLPSPPKQITRRTPHHQHRGSAGAVFAGIALQDVVSPDHPSGKISSGGKISSSRSLEDDGLFGGFDAGTKRELRAGLRFGEELAKRQSSSPPAKVEPSISLNKTISTNIGLQPLGKQDFEPLPRHQPQTQIWRGETTVQRTPVQMFNPIIPKPAALADSIVRTPENPASKKSDAVLMDTLARREREWQLDREAVSREIENASASQVIIIDSDDETQAVMNPRPDVRTSTRVDEPITTNAISSYEEDDDEDIWLAEAKNSSSPHAQQPQPIQQNTNGFLSESEQRKQGDVAREVVSRPRRSLIPSPWKRGDDVSVPEEPSTLLSTRLDDQTGILFWEQQQAGKAKLESGLAQRNQLRPRRSSGKFDIDLMLGTPGKTQHYDSGLDLTCEKIPQSYQEQDVSEHTGSHDAVDQSMSSSVRREELLQDPINNTFGEPDAISSPEPPLRIPVNFNDSMDLSTTGEIQNGQRYGQARLQSPFKDSNTRSESSPPRPPTPRSAMKGSRQISGPEMGFKRPDTPTMNRRVIFSERSRGVDVHGLESSFSMKSGSGSEDSVAGQLRDQLEGELLAGEDTIETSYVDEEEDTETEIALEQEMPQEDAVVEAPPVSKPSDSKSGWRSWLWSDKKSNTEASAHVDQSNAPNLSVPAESGQQKPLCGQDNAAHHPAWTQTITSTIPSTRVLRQSLPKTPSQATLPSYLLPPSYPSDPTRSLKTPLATTGSFSNTHFRTLHIIYRKSLRPKFHAPKHIRPAVRRLLGTQMEIDESEQGIDRGVMTWTVGEGECEVLERFMQEVEYGYGVGPAADGEVCGGEGSVIWGWSVQQLAHWLCRIVVGEVVREEETRAKMKAKAKSKAKGTN